MAEAIEPVQRDGQTAELLGRMTLVEKIGQMTQVNSAEGTIPDDLHEAVKAGRIGSILNEVNVDVVNELQRIATRESRLGIPLLMGRDVVHGFKTVLPIPLGQAVAGLSQWGTNFLVTMTFPVFLASIGLLGAYGIYAVFAAVSAVFVHKLVHETRGLELEEMQG